ncbi:MAG: DUF4349 domain-containing protein [Chloroflexota bacterium]
MERSSEHDGLAVALAELRPTPEAEFAAELDAWVAAGCPPRSRVRRLLPAALGKRLRVPRPRQMAFAGGVAALIAIAVATALISTDSGSPARTAIDRSGRGALLNAFSNPVSESAHPEGASSAEAQLAAPSSAHRDIERSAQVTLLASPADVAGDSAEVFTAVHDAHGIVLRSHTTQGPAGRAGASFYLLIPSARLGGALAAISAIDEVGSRNDATADITAPTVAVGKRLTETHASIESLLSQIAAAETEAEREVLEAKLRGERRRATALQAQLDRLHKRTRYSHLTVRIEAGHSSSANGPWGIDNAFHDAGHVLGVAAGVTLLALAVLAPLALIVLLAWLAHRAWLRIRRERALS